MLRRLTNAALRTALLSLEEAGPNAVGQVLRCTSWLAGLAGLPISDYLNETLIRDIAVNIARGITETDYGSPLQLQHPLIVTVASSDYCPFACNNCYSNSGRSNGHDTSSGTSDILRQVARSKIPFVMITGGEPLAAADIHSGLESLLDAGKVVYVFTNLSTVRFLPLARRYSDTLRFVFPVWGTPKVHDVKRGARSFERLEKSLEAFSASDLPSNLLAVIADDDLSVFDTVGDLCTQYRISTVRIIRKVLVGRHDGARVDFSPQFRTALKQRIRGLQEIMPGGVVNDIPEFRGARRFGSSIQKLLGIPSYGSCAAGNWMMHVDSAGAAYPCFTFEGSSRFSIKPDVPLDEQWLQMRKIRDSLGDHVCVGEAHAST